VKVDGRTIRVLPAVDGGVPSEYWDLPLLSAAFCPHPGKERFESREAAKRRPVGFYARVYRCRCGGWHLTSQSPGGR
jgi:hypothetical protein